MIPFFIVFVFMEDDSGVISVICQKCIFRDFYINTSNAYNLKLYNFFMVLGAREYDSDVIFMI